MDLEAAYALLEVVDVLLEDLGGRTAAQDVGFALAVDEEMELACRVTGDALLRIQEPAVRFFGVLTVLDPSTGCFLHRAPSPLKGIGVRGI